MKTNLNWNDLRAGFQGIRLGDGYYTTLNTGKEVYVDSSGVSSLKDKPSFNYRHENYQPNKDLIILGMFLVTVIAIIALTKK